MGGLDDQRYGALQFEGVTSPAVVLDMIEAGFRAAGASHFLATGQPLPGRPIEPLLLRFSWGDMRHEPAESPINLGSNDPLLLNALCLHRSVCDTADCLLGHKLTESPLFSTSGLSRHDRFVIVPINAFLPYQAVIVAAGKELNPCGRELGMLDYFSVAGFGRLVALNAINLIRPGALSVRERRVVELSALGLTAQEIADNLRISQRTVHAHLQNASTKLMAGNKTQTVVEALRYGQISIDRP